MTHFGLGISLNFKENVLHFINTNLKPINPCSLNGHLSISLHLIAEQCKGHSQPVY